MGLDAIILVFWMLSFKPAFSLSSFTFIRGSFVPPHFLPLKLYHLHIWGCWYFFWQSWFQLVIHSAYCYFLVCAVLSHVRLFATPWVVACQAPLSMEILQARILEWVAMPSSRRSSQSRDQSQVSLIVDKFFTIWTIREVHAYWSGSPIPFQGIFPTQESNQGLLHCRRILYLPGKPIF